MRCKAVNVAPSKVVSKASMVNFANYIHFVDDYILYTLE